MRKLLPIFVLVLVLAAIGLVSWSILKPKPVENAAKVAKLQQQTTVFKQDTGLAVNKKYQADKYTIIYSGEAVAYYVTIDAKTVNDYHKAKKEAETVFSKNGLSSPCQIRIFFIPSKELQNSDLKPADGRFTGC